MIIKFLFPFLISCNNSGRSIILFGPIIAENDGQVIFGKEVRGKQRVSIVPEDGNEPSNYLIPKGKHINFNQG
ncbi:MAG: hypothetical protein ACFFC3_14810, partial [Candidatus Odinarchaeota archaeon]